MEDKSERSSIKWKFLSNVSILQIAEIMEEEKTNSSYRKCSLGDTCLG